MSESGKESPWALTQRLRGEGASFERIVQALEAEGLARDDLELLLQDVPGFRAWSRGTPPKPAPASAAPPTPVPEVPTDWGRVARWVVITLSGFAGGLVAAFTTGASGAAFTVAALGPALVLLALEIRRGLRRTARSLAFVAFFSFIYPALSGFIGGWSAPQVGAACLFVLSVPLLVWSSRSAETLRGLADFGAGSGSVFESGDVQFTVRWSDATVGPGEHVDVVVLAQNCVDVTRELRLIVRGDRRSQLAPLEHSLALAPGAVAELRVPVRVPPSAPERFGFTVDLAGSGATAGRRVRLARGAEWLTPSEALLGNLLGVATLGTLGAGLFTLGSNGVITVKVDPERPPSTAERTLQTIEHYRPAPAALEAAATS